MRDEPAWAPSPPCSFPEVAIQLFFGDYRLDVQDESLWLGEERLALNPKAFGVLQHLAEHAGTLVTKEQILERVWEGAFVTDAVVKVAVSEIRRALQDDARAARYIVTVHRRGYRFVADVTRTEAAQPARADVPRPELIGRDQELAWLDHHLEEARHGRGGLILVTGDAGIGKTALLDAFAARAAESGFQVARGTCVEHFGEGEPYMPLLECMGRLCRGREAERATDVLRRFAPTWLTQLPWLVDDASRSALAERTLGANAARMLREMADALEELCAHVPVALVLEDLHWSDVATVELLAYLARARRGGRLLLVGSFRPVDLVLSQHPLREVWQDLKVRRLTQELELGYLDEPCVEELLAERLGSPELARELKPDIFVRSAGNPLFVHSIVEFLMTRGALVSGGGTWQLGDSLDRVVGEIPESLRLLVEKQVEQLDAEALEVLEGAAIIGFEFSAAAAAQALSSDVRAVENSCLRLARQRLFLDETGLVSLPDGSVSRRFRFRHVVHQTVLYERMDTHVRRARHRSAAEGAVRVYGAQVGEIAHELMVHFEEAEMPKEAILFLRRTAARVAQRYANRERVDFLTHALSLCARLPEGDRVTQEMTVLPELIDAKMSMADMVGAADSCRQLRQLSTRLGKPRAEVAALLLQASAESWIDRETCLETLAELDRSCRQLPRHDLDRGRARAFVSYWHLLWKGWRPRDFEACVEVVELERRRDSSAVLCPLLARLSMFHALRSDYPVSVAAAREARQLAVSLGAAPEYMLALFYEVWSALHAGESELVRDLVATGSDLARRNDHRLWRSLFLLQEAWLELHEARHGSARELCLEGLELAHGAGMEYGKLLGELLRGAIEVASGSLEEGAQRLESLGHRLQRERVLMDWVLRMPLLAALIDVEVERERPDELEKRCNELRDVATAPGERTYMALACAGEVGLASLTANHALGHDALRRGLTLVEQSAESGCGPLLLGRAALERRAHALLAEAPDEELEERLASALALAPGDFLGRVESPHLNQNGRLRV